MSELFHTFGINWKLLLAQAGNFLVVVLVLTFTIYKPLVKVLGERRRKIERGLADAEAAKQKLEGIDRLEKERLAEAEREAIRVLARSEEAGKGREAEIVRLAKRKEEEILETAEKVARAKQEEAREEVYREAGRIVKEAIVKTVQAKPEAIDEALIAAALGELKKLSKS